MKWENRDINDVERVNIPKISKLDDIVTPFILFELFFDDVLHDSIVAPSCTVIERKWVGAISFQTVKCIGRQLPILLCKEGLIQYLVIRSSVFFGISFFATTNNLINKTNSRSSFP